MKLEIKAKEEELKKLHARLEEACDFGDKKAVSLFGTAFRLKAQLRENHKWDQGKLAALCERIGDDEFQRFFTWEFKPKTMKEFDRIVELLPYAEELKGCYTKSRAATYFAYEPLEG